MGYSKVLVVSNMYPSEKFPSYGVFVKNFCNQLEEIGIQYDLSVLTKNQNKLIKILKYYFFYIKTFFKSWLGDYDLVYIHYPSFSSKPVLIAQKLRKFDIISNVHGSDVIPLKVEHEMMIRNTKKAMSQSRRVVVPSEYYRNLVIQKYDIANENIIMYPSAGIDERVFYVYCDEKKAKLLKEYDISKDTFTIGFVSRINKAKGWDVFIEAIEKNDWMTEAGKVRIFIVGSGEDDQELENRIEKLASSIRNCIIRYPLLTQQKLADIYNLMDVFVFPTMSASESLGLVAIEAMACGVPVIASDYAAPAYYVIDGMNGFKFEKGNSRDLNKIFKAHMNEFRKSDKLRKGAVLTAKEYSRLSIQNTLSELFF